MRIQHNISAMNAGRNLRKNQSSLNKNLEKLSSGYRINRSADDAAGLAISERMRLTVSALTQAENNVMDGISLVQTADGAMQEIQDMLCRMTSLAVQAGNDTLSDEDREKIQDEIDQILKEITRVRNTTEFNGIPLLQGDEATVQSPAVYIGSLPAWVQRTQGGAMNDVYYTTENYTSATGSPSSGSVQVPHAAAKLDFSQGFDKASLLANSDTGFYTTCCTCDNHYSIKFNDGEGNGLQTSGSHFIYNVDISGVNSGDALVDAILAVTGTNPQGHYTMLAKGAAGELIIYDDRPTDTTFKSSLPSDVTFSNWANSTSSGARPSPSSNEGLFDSGVAYDKSTVALGDISLQIGQEADDKMEIVLANVSLAKLGITGLSVTTTANAKAAVPKITTAVQYVSGERSRMGAYQNRLEHTYSHLGNTVENLSASESQIRDANMAEEMMGYTKHSILIQSAQAMLAQSNQVPQGVLQLMR